MNGELPMTQSMTLSEVSDQLTLVVDRVFRRETRVLVEQEGMAVVAIVSAGDLERLDRLDQERAERFRVIDRLQDAFKDVPAEKIDREADRAVAAIRAETRDAR